MSVNDLGAVPASTTIYLYWTSHDLATGANETMSGLATSDILIYKNGSTTQRSSTAGFTLLDTDGIDFDALTGVNGVSIDLSDNTDAGFYAVGSWYTVILGPVTIDTQTVYVNLATFRIVAAEAITGKPKVDVDGWLGTAAATPTVAGVPEVDLTHVAGATTNVAALATNVDAILTDTADMQPKLGTPAGASVSADIAAVTSTLGTPNDVDIATDIADAQAGITTLLGRVGPTDLSNILSSLGVVQTALIVQQGTAQAGAAGTLTLESGASATNDQYNGDILIITDGTGFGQARLISDYVGATKVASVSPNWTETPDNTSVYVVAPFAVMLAPDIRAAVGLASANLDTQLTAIDDYIDTEVAAIKAKTDNLPASPAATGDIPSAATIADAVWDEALSGHTTAGTGGKALSDIDTHTDTETGAAAIRAAVGLASANLDTQLAAIVADTNEVQAELADGGRTDLLIDAIKAKTDNIPASPAAVSDIPTATENADALLKRDWTSVTGEAARSVLNALRALRNRVAISSGTVTVYEEDDTTSAWTAAATTDASADPITEVDPS